MCQLIKGIVSSHHANISMQCMWAITHFSETIKISDIFEANKERTDL